MNLSPHFTLKELSFSYTAIRLGLTNVPPPEVIPHLRALCVEVLEPLRTALGNKPITIWSGYRSPKVNQAVGGERSSQHRKGMACDLTVIGVPQPKVFHALRTSGLIFDQLIDEFSSFCHVSFRLDGRNRRQILRARKVGGKTVYTQLTASGRRSVSRAQVEGDL